MKMHTNFHNTFAFIFFTISSPILYAHECNPVDPLIVDLGSDGFEFSEKGNGVIFDISGNGEFIEMQWVRMDGNEAFLFRDANNNGIVDHGGELFGDNTALSDGSGLLARNGFMALAQFDRTTLGGDDDGVITKNDLIWNELAFWLDRNADGISTPDEIITMDESLIYELPIIPKVKKNSVDEAGNTMPLMGKARGYKIGKNGKLKNRKFDVVDVFFHLLGE